MPERVMIEVANDPIVQAKATLRERFRAYRTRLNKAAYEARSAAILSRVKALPELTHASTVHVYWPMTARREVDTRPLIRWLHEVGKQIVLPVVVSFEKNSANQPRLRHVRLEPQTVLRPNRWGLHEPTAGKSVPVEEIDIVLVPALGAGRNGHRIGHGFGYYDAFLQHLDVPTVGLLYAACLVEHVPAAIHDVALDIVITEDECLRPNADVTS